MKSKLNFPTKNEKKKKKFVDEDDIMILIRNRG
jgi:hypothetical protein